MTHNQKLAADLLEWFNQNRDRQNKWNDNEVGRVLKQEFQKLNNWKNAPRGNPSKGGRAALMSKNSPNNTL